MRKIEQLKEQLIGYKNLAVAFSGGVDSSFLLNVANEVLGKNVSAFTIDSPYMARYEIDEAKEFCKEKGINHIIINAQISEQIATNPLMRCYFCKSNVFKMLIAKGRELGFENFADGTNKDDLGEFRPGLKALSELGVISPLTIFTKDEIRKLSKEFGLKTHDKPSYACLLTRLPQDYKFSLDDIKIVELAETTMMSYGYKNVRARYDTKCIKIELNQKDMSKFLADENFKEIIKTLNSLGKHDIVLDLKGLRQEVLQ
ncbi:ATP-dependent sacrificial sulfur transferase LarE [Campylobacter mucosalis]|uniref:ATP-dependent sacrificial sulfur transferase LarE n=1 Tax=Campylobacter mucosalis TaxID=202 RepID=UPI00146FEECC